jgi:hypothetical protein
MSTNTLVIEDPYSYDVLFSKNHIKTNLIIDKIRLGKFNEILDGYIRINDNGLVIEPKYLKHFASQLTYDLIVNYMDQLIVQLLTKNCDKFNMYINFQSLSIIDLEKHINFCKYLAALFSNKYPDKLNMCYLYKTSMVFETIFNLVKGFIDKVTLNKIHLVKE